MAAAQARWLQPKVVPSMPYFGAMRGEIEMAPIGKPLPIPLAIE